MAITTLQLPAVPSVGDALGQGISQGIQLNAKRAIDQQNRERVSKGLQQVLSQPDRESAMSTALQLSLIEDASDASSLVKLLDEKYGKQSTDSVNITGVTEEGREVNFRVTEDEALKVRTDKDLENLTGVKGITFGKPTPEGRFTNITAFDSSGAETKIRVRSDQKITSDAELQAVSGNKNLTLKKPVGQATVEVYNKQTGQKTDIRIPSTTKLTNDAELAEQLGHNEFTLTKPPTGEFHDSEGNFLGVFALGHEPEDSVAKRTLTAQGGNSAAAQEQRELLAILGLPNTTKGRALVRKHTNIREGLDELTKLYTSRLGKDFLSLEGKQGEYNEASRILFDKIRMEENIGTPIELLAQEAFTEVAGGEEDATEPPPNSFDNRSGFQKLIESITGSAVEEAVPLAEQQVGNLGKLTLSKPSEQMTDAELADEIKAARPNLSAQQIERIVKRQRLTERPL